MTAHRTHCIRHAGHRGADRRGRLHLALRPVWRGLMALCILLALSAGCSTYQRTAPSELRPGIQKVAVRFREMRAMEARDSGSILRVAGVYGEVERMNADTLFIRVGSGFDERGRSIRLARANVPMAIAIADTQKIEVSRFSAGRTLLILVGVVAFGLISVAQGDLY